MIRSYFNKLLAIKEAFDSSKEYSEKTFYIEFLNSLKNVKSEVIIESPFITTNRVRYFLPIFKKLVRRNIKVIVYTRIIEEQSEEMQYKSEAGIDLLEEAGVFVIQTKGFLHRKLAIIDKTVVWEGSLNILSQSYSSEFMRRIKDKKISEKMLKFLNLN